MLQAQLLCRGSVSEPVPCIFTTVIPFSAIRKPERLYMPSNTTHLSGLVGQDVGVTSINDGHGRAAPVVSI